MTPARKPPTCSHCLCTGHTKASPQCPLKGSVSAPRPAPKPSTHWTDDQEKQLVEGVKTCPLPTDWAKIAAELGRKELSCRNRYHGLVEPLDEVRVRGQLLAESPAFVQSIADSLRKACTACHRVFYDAGHDWRGEIECDECSRSHCRERRALWAGVESAYHSCEWCGRKRAEGACLQLDHLNMFEKGDSVCSMINRGDSLETILAEAAQCQVLCASCHSVVTSVERQLGLHRAKGSLTRSAANDEADLSAVSEGYAELADVYAAQMRVLYPLIRASMQQRTVS
jgi:hypothetical protein